MTSSTIVRLRVCEIERTIGEECIELVSAPLAMRAEEIRYSGFFLGDIESAKSTPLFSL
jgi:hypothetical protein